MLKELTVIAALATTNTSHGSDSNLIVDPGLESQEPLAWTGSSAAAERAQVQPHSGKSCLYIKDQSDSQGQANSPAFKAAPGPCFVEAWVRVDPDFPTAAVAPKVVVFDVQYFDAKGQFISSDSVGQTSSPEWAHLHGTVTVPENAATIMLRLMPTGVSAASPGQPVAPLKGACFADDFYFAPLATATKEGRLKPQRRTKPLDEAGLLDDSLVLHYRFDRDPGKTAADLSGFGNNGKILNGQFLPEVEGRRGVLRLDGKTSYIDCGNAESMDFAGDMSFEMWVRFNQPMAAPTPNWPILYGEYPPDKFCFLMPYTHTLAVWYRNLENITENTWLPVDATMINQTWSHIAVVFEYPRCRFYQNGKLYRDAYMPFPGVVTHTDAAKHQHIGGGPEANYAAPLDLTEFRLYRRALSVAEVAAHAKGQELAPPPAAELAVEPNWYKDIVTLRLTCKGSKCDGQIAEIAVTGAIATSAKLTEALPGSGRFVATATVPLSKFKGKSFTAVAKVANREAQPLLEARQEFSLEKPEWIHSQAGIIDKVLAPWTPITTESRQGEVAVGVWGRRYVFDGKAIVQQVESGGAAILAAPITLTARADGQAINWQDTPVKLASASDTTASIEQARRNPVADLRVTSRVEYDGFITIECELKANRNLTLDEVTLDIPMLTKFANFCAGDYVLPKKPNISMSPMYRGSVTGDLSFQFGPTVWLGNDNGGLCWEAESDEDWHYANAQKAIEILPRGDTTHFRAHFVDVPTKLAAGESLHYKFSLQATPLKPLTRDAWNMRIGRSEPYGADLKLPDKIINGKPALQHLADQGVRHLFINVNDEFPWPMPKRKVFADAVLRLNKAAHAAGLKIYCYSIHARVPVMRPEFDIYGSDMLMRPARQYMQAVSPMERPGPLPWAPDMLPLPQGSADFCQKSQALQDAYMHALNQRVTTFGDDGVYLDGSYCAEPCQNMEHGCGYRAKDGTIRPTYPVFASREFMKRIYTIVHVNKPDGVVDLHSSFFFKVSGLAYADVIWTGEQWYELRGKGAGYIAGTLTLDMFRTEFTGWPLGVPAETLSYRLGKPMKVAATSLLHDISPRYSTDAYDNLTQERDPYYKLMPALWKLRDDFGVEQAEKLFYWKNRDYVTVSPEKCYATLFKHPKNGVLAFVSNLRPDAQTVTVQFNLDKLGLRDQKLDAFNALTGEAIPISADGKLSMPLDSEHWQYIWLRPKTGI